MASVWAFLRRPSRLLALVLSVIGVIGLTVAFAAAGKLRDPWPDISKAGVTVAAVSVAGAVVTATFRYLDGCRARDEQLRRIFHDILANYNQVKAVRRNLEALGMYTFNCGNNLNEDQAKQLREQMTELNAAQLSFEAIARELKHSDLAEDLRKIVIAELEAVEKYLNKHVVDKWQEAGRGSWVGANATKIEALDLKAFIGGRGDGHFDFEEVSTRLDHIALVLQGKLFGHPTPDETETWWKGRLKHLEEQEAEFRIRCPERST